jgi:hypothetical protein
MKVVIHGIPCKRVGTRYFALPKQHGLAFRIANDSHAALHGNKWQAVMRQPIGTRVLVNQKRADARRDARMRRLVVKARFT